MLYYNKALYKTEPLQRVDLEGREQITSVDFIGLRLNHFNLVTWLQRTLVQSWAISPPVPLFVEQRLLGSRRFQGWESRQINGLPVHTDVVRLHPLPPNSPTPRYSGYFHNKAGISKHPSKNYRLPPEHITSW